MYKNRNDMVVCVVYFITIAKIFKKSYSKDNLPNILENEIVNIYWETELSCQ